MTLAISLFQIKRCPNTLQSSFCKYANSVCQNISFLHRMCCQDNWFTFLHLLYEMPDLLFNLRIKTCSWLIKKNYLRTTYSSNSETQSSLHSSTESTNFIFLFWQKIDKAKNIINFLLNFIFTDTFEPSKHIEMFLGSQLIPKNIKLWANSNMFPDLIYIVNRSIVNDDLHGLSRVRSDDSCEYIDQSCFSCTVMSQNTHQLISIYL